jgi:hypothetical protein
MQWHASRSVSHRTKDIDLTAGIGYNLSNWTGLEKEPTDQGYPQVASARSMH